VAVANASEFLFHTAHYVTIAPGGEVLSERWPS